MKFCEECGAQLLDEAVFCEECGATIGKAENVQPKEINTIQQSTVTPKNKSIFKINLIWGIVTGVIVLFSVVVFIIMFKNSRNINNELYSENFTMQGEMEKLESRITALKDENNELKRSNNKLKNTNDALNKQLDECNREIEFIDACVVFVENDGTNFYHKYACSKFIGNEFWAYNSNAAVGNGYKPCPYCYGN